MKEKINELDYIKKKQTTFEWEKNTINKVKRQLKSEKYLQHLYQLHP